MLKLNKEEIAQVNALENTQSVYLKSSRLQVTRSKLGKLRVCNKIKNTIGEVILMTCRDLPESELE